MSPRTFLKVNAKHEGPFLPEQQCLKPPVGPVQPGAWSMATVSRGLPGADVVTCWKHPRCSAMTSILHIRRVFLAGLKLGVLVFSFFSFLYIDILSKVVFESAAGFLQGSSFCSAFTILTKCGIAGFKPLQTTRASVLLGFNGGNNPLSFL